jgi:hypothetical protein
MRPGDVYRIKARGNPSTAFIWEIRDNEIELRLYANSTVGDKVYIVSPNELRTKWKLVQRNNAGKTYVSLLSKETLEALRVRK